MTRESEADRLRGLTDQELDAVVAELEARAEMFDARVRMLVHDELRRRHRTVRVA
jgi:hypothetical protein